MVAGKSIRNRTGKQRMPLLELSPSLVTQKQLTYNVRGVLHLV